MVSTNLQEWIKRPELLNRETLYELRNVLARYPYFQTVRLLYLKNLYLLHDASFGRELRKAALYVSDRRTLFYLIEADKFIIRAKKEVESARPEEEPGLDRTLSLIDAFLASIPEETTQSPVLDISTDYAAYLLKEKELTEKEPSGEVPRLKGQQWIDNFIQKAGEGETMKLGNSMEITENKEDDEVKEEDYPIETEEEDDSYFTETLAKIYVKQKRYSKALEIIKKLSLKYPKKNAYFADQIRFLEKLIINTKSK